MSIRTKHRLYFNGAIAAALMGSCQSKSFEHGDAPDVSSASMGFVSAGGEVGGSEFPNADGNYPEPAVTRCGDVLGSLPPIQGLASAWAVVAVPGATVDGVPIEAGSVLLRVSEQAISECGDAPESQELFGSSGPGSTGTSGGVGTTTSGGGSSRKAPPRGFEVMLAPQEFTLGIHDLATLAAPGAFAYGEGATGESAADATIELLRLDDDCVVGVVRGFVSDTGLPFMDGGFVAQTCQRQCIPSEGKPC